MYQRMSRGGMNREAGGIARERKARDPEALLVRLSADGRMRIARDEKEIDQTGESAGASLGSRRGASLRFGERMTIVVREVNAPFMRALRNDGDSAVHKCTVGSWE